MAYFAIEPEVAGGWGDGTAADSSVHPPRVERLDYRFDGWLGDALLESFPCFIVTAELGDALVAQGLTGFDVAACKVSRSSQFCELHSETTLPEFRWLQVSGAAGQDDFGISSEHALVVSEAALSVLKQHGIEHCEMVEWPQTLNQDRRR